MTALQRRYPSRPESAAVVRRDLRQFALACGYYPYVVDDIIVAVGEACSNIIEHSQTQELFLVDCECQGDCLTISLEDHGHGFAQQSPAETFLPQPRGYGIHMMRMLMDKVEYVHKPGNGTIVRLEKRKVREASAMNSFAAE